MIAFLEEAGLFLACVGISLAAVPLAFIVPAVGVWLYYLLFSDERPRSQLVWTRALVVA